MKKILWLVVVILCSLAFQSCFCAHDFYGPGTPPPPHHHPHGAPPPRPFRR